jgi:hypothetical protein
MSDRRLTYENKKVVSSREGGMGMPLAWHRRHALLLASQLPDDLNDAKLIVEAVSELLETFLAVVPVKELDKASNVLPFAAG